MSRPSALVCGAGGFIGSHLVRGLKSEGLWVRGVDLKRPEFSETAADDFVLGDLRDRQLLSRYPRQGIRRGLSARRRYGRRRLYLHRRARCRHHAEFRDHQPEYAAYTCSSARSAGSSTPRRPASIRPIIRKIPTIRIAPRSRLIPLRPDSEYGWEKLFSERLYLSYHRNYGIPARVARYHNIFGPEGTWCGGREKAPAAICRKVAMARDGGEIEIWGDGHQTRSFLAIDECVEGTLRLARSSFLGPVNIGSSELVTVNQLVDIVSDIAGKRLIKRHVPGPTGVRGRNSDNRLIEEKLGWAPSKPLRAGLEETYVWIEQQTRRVQDVAA